LTVPRGKELEKGKNRKLKKTRKSHNEESARKERVKPKCSSERVPQVHRGIREGRGIKEEQRRFY